MNSRYREYIPYTVIVLLLLYVIYNGTAKDTTTTPREIESKQFIDSVGNVNRGLEVLLLKKDSVLRELEIEREIAEQRVRSVDKSIEKLNKQRNNEVNSIKYISLDSSIIILTRLLSKEDSY